MRREFFVGRNWQIRRSSGIYRFFAHLGFNVVDDWCVVGEFHGSEEHSTKGPLGDIRGRPNAEDLDKVRKDTVELLKRIFP